MPRILQGLPGLEDHRDGQEGMAGGTEPGDQHAATMETEYPVAQETGQGRDPGKEVMTWQKYRFQICLTRQRFA